MEGWKGGRMEEGKDGRREDCEEYHGWPLLRAYFLKLRSEIHCAF